MDRKDLAKVALATYAGYTIYHNLKQEEQKPPMKIRKGSPKVIVIGGGISGICMSIKLAEKGIDHIVFEKEADVGGTWFLSNYPGVQCDVPSHGYCYSFEMNPDWSTAYAPANEIFAYLKRVAVKYRVTERCRFNTEVLSSTWDEQNRKWKVEICCNGVKESHEADFLISGIGALHFPQYPDVTGRGTFKNGLEMHSAEWKKEADFSGKRVVVIGSAASAVQIVPSVAETAKQVTCIQRTPNWLAPQRHPVLPTSLRYGAFIRWCFRHLPGLLLLHRWIVYWSCESIFYPLGIFSSGSTGLGQRITRYVLTRFMSAQLGGNKELIEKVIPNYGVGCKRIIRSERFLPALLKDHVELVTDKVTRIEPTGVVVKDESSGKDRLIETDMIIYATGYQVGSLGRFQLKGCNDIVVSGRALVETNTDTYYGICSTSFPNSFIMLGPNTGLGHNSIIIMIETQANFIAQCISLAADNNVKRLSVKQKEVDNFMKFMKETMKTTVWSAGGCSSWYQGKDGTVPTVWPLSTVRYMIEAAPPADLKLFDCL